MCRERIGIHIEKPAILRGANAGDHRKIAAAAQVFEQGRPTTPGRLTNFTKVHFDAARGDSRCGTLDAADSGIRAGEADGSRACRTQRGNEARVDTSGQYTDDDLERRFISDAQSIDLTFR